MDTTSDQLDYEENIFDKIKRLDLGQKSIGDVVKEIDTLRADNAALRANLMALLTALEVKEIDDLMTKNQEYFSKLGEVIKDNITDRDIKIITLRERLARLVEYLQKAPHQMGCSSLQDKVPREKYGSLELCDCWKIEAIAAAEEDK